MNIARAIVDLLTVCGCAAAIGLILSQPGIKTKRVCTLWFIAIFGLIFAAATHIPTNAIAFIHIFFAIISFCSVIVSKRLEKAKCAR